MARAASAPKYPVALAAGIVNRMSEAATPAGAVREASDVDIHASGAAESRTGITATGEAGGHSLWSWPGFAGWLYVSGSSLRYVSRGLAGATVATVSRGLPMSYAYVNGSVYYSNGLDMGIVRADGTFRRWGFPTPPAPALVATGSGFSAARYHVAWTAIYDDGEESAPSKPSLISLSSAGGIQISSVPAATGATALRIYRTGCDGDNLFKSQTVALPFAGALTVQGGDFGARLETLHHDPMVAGAPLAFYNRRVYAARGRYLYYSTDKQLSLTKRRHNFLNFPEPITMLGAVTDGLYVGTASAVYRVTGPDPDEAALEVVDRQGCLYQPRMPWLPGSIFPQERLPTDGPVVAWVSVDGTLCTGRPGGIVQRIQESTLALPGAARVSLSYYDVGGLTQVRVSMEGAYTNPAAYPAEAVTTTYEQGVTLVDTTGNIFILEQGGNFLLEQGGNFLLEQ